MLLLFSDRVVIDSFATPWTIARQAPLSMGLSRQEYWSGCHALLLRIFPTQGLKPHFLHWEEDSLPLSHQQNPKSSNWWLYTWPFLRLIDFINNTKITIPKGEESTPKNEWMNKKQIFGRNIICPFIYRTFTEYVVLDRPHIKTWVTDEIMRHCPWQGCRI